MFRRTYAKQHNTEPEKGRLVGVQVRLSALVVSCLEAGLGSLFGVPLHYRVSGLGRQWNVYVYPYYT